MNSEVKKAWITMLIELVVIVNAVLEAKGISPLPLGEAEITEYGSYVLGLIAFVHACWKNHNFSLAAAKAQELLKGFKEDGIGGEDA